MSRISHFSRILLLLTLALLPRLAQTQRIGPLGPTDRQQSKALSTERTAAVGPPSLQLSLPPPAVVALPPLGPDDLQLLQPQEGQPPVIGIHRPLPPGSVSLSFSGGTARTTAEGAWQAIPAGRLWRLRITSPSARAMRVHFRDFAIGAGKLWLYSADGQTVGPYTGSGLYGDGNFWSDIVSGDSLTIEYLPDPVVTEEAVPFQIVEISHIWGGAFGGGGEAGVQPPIAASGGARTGREAAKLLTDWINVVVGTQSMEQSPAADNPPDTKMARIAKQIQLVERSASLQQPRPKAATPLTPGRPVSFSRGPVDSSTLFTGDHSFQLLVPENATSVTFTLESVDPDIDMDLFVRYGEDNDLQNGRAVSDYSSEGLTGNEEIVITPQSDPPLRAGTYFVSVALFDTGVVAMATLTAEVERDDTPLPPISGGTLTPGQPSAFRLGPVESPTLFIGDKSFRLEVPTGASRVIFTLESVDPDVDVALLVRYGEDNDIQDGRLVFDHRSRNPEGNERIGITRQSDPPLRAGTYFVSIVVFATGVVAEGTLTATVETDVADCHLDATCYPEWSSSATGVARISFETGASSSFCSGTLLNNSREDSTPYFLTAAHCVATEEEARSVMAFWHYQTQTCNGELPDILSVPRTEGARLLSTTGFRELYDPEGDMTLLQLEGDLPDGVMFQGWDADPQPIGSQVTGIHHPGSDDWGFFKRISFGQIIPDQDRGTSDDVYAIVRYTQGLIEGGSSGSALFSSPETVVGVQSFGPPNVYDCSDAPFYSGTTHFSVFYPYIRQFIDSASPLTPGQPAAFRLGPVDAPTLFRGDNSFRLEVPENATRVTFTLESIDPDVNVDLYVRYGEDNAIQDGNVVSDYSSEGSTGNEQIVVTRQSDPPLRAGTYFVSLMLRTTGAVAEVTVTAEFDAPQQTGGPTYYFPHLAVGASWQTTITYINFSSQEVTCRTDFLSDHGTPLMVSFAGLGTVDSRTDVLPPGGSVHQETDVNLNASLAPGWARATCSGPVQASLLYRQHNSEGMPTAEAGVNATAVPATRFVTFAEQGEGKNGTGVAYANPSDTAALVTFTARDADGEVLAIEDLTLPPNGHDAQNMPTLFDLSSFAGSLEVTSTAPIVSLSLNFEADPVFSSLPPGELDASAQGSTTYYFPHLAVGASWQTTITYINYSREEVTCRTDFLSDHGTPLMVSFAELGMVDSRTDVLPPGGSVHQETNVELSAPLAPGWARANCSGPVQASLLYRQHNSEGMPTAEAGVNATAVPATRFVTFAEQGEGKNGTGVAYANPSDTAALVTFTARDADGEVLAIEDLMLPPNGHDAQNMPTLFDLSSFTGSLEVTSTAPIVSLSLNFEADPVFSSLPPGEVDAAPDVPGEMFAPASEAAFNTLFVGKRVATNFPTVYVDFVSPGRFRETAGTATSTGSYTYRNTGPNTGTVTFNYDDGDRCTAQLTFTSATTGTAISTCNDRSSVRYNWHRVEIPASGTPDLVIQTPSVSDSSPNAGESFTLSATVRNQGNGLSASTTLRYYRSTDATISTGDTQVGTDPVSGLSASGASDESLSLTAPSTAGTYYYGACVDPVSGESDTRNNCSTAVRVTVSASQMASAGFDLASVNGNPQGIVYANDRFFVVDLTAAKVYAYQSWGQRDSASDFDLDSANENALGITFANNRFYVVDGTDDKVYAYHATGQRDSAADFDLHADNADLGGITFANSRFFVVDFADDKVYAYSASGQRESAAGFDLHADNEWQAGITFANNRFFVPDATDDKVYAYSASGQRESAADFGLHVDSGNPRGITFTNNRFFVVDTTDDKVYVLNPTAPDLVVESPSVSSSTPATGQSFEFRATVRNQGPSTSTATTLRYYRSTNSTISTSDTQVGTDAVGALSRQATSAETITLTAPSAAGTYYYGACVDPVAEETGTGNNCSSAVRVTVGSSGGSGDAITGTITECSGTRITSSLVSVTIRGTIQAHRAVSSVRITGRANGSFVGFEFLGSMSAGESQNFLIEGFAITSEPSLRCEVEMQVTLQ